MYLDGKTLGERNARKLMTDKPFQPRYKFGSDEEWQKYNDIEDSGIIPIEPKNKAVGWEVSETIYMSLINCTRCEKCNKTVWYNGLPPEWCPSCEEPIELYMELIEKYYVQ